ncbi:MAG: hypothetical protein V8R40_07485 [Dysosmobacter sp.]
MKGQTKTYELSTGKLRVEYGEDGTLTLLPQLAGDEDPYVLRRLCGG